MDVFQSITWREVVEILVITLVVFLILRFLRGTRGLGILKGLIALQVGLYLLLQLTSRQWGLANVQYLIRVFLTGSLLLIVVVFQPELRRAFFRLGRNPLVRLFMHARSHVIDEVVRAAAFLASERSGALVVLTRQHGLGHVIETGVPLDAEVSAELLCTIFHPGAQLHDMAAVVAHDRVAAAKCRLPLSDNPAVAKRRGTRHLAAVGITEESDAVCVVVSEETGRISVAVNGRLFEGLTESQLGEMLSDLLSEKEISAQAVPPATPLGPTVRPVSARPEPAAPGAADAAGEEVRRA